VLAGQTFKWEMFYSTIHSHMVKHCKNEYPLLYSCMHMAVSQPRQLAYHQRGPVSIPGQCTWLRGEQSGIQTGFFWVLHLSPVNYHSTSSSYSSIYHLGLVKLDHDKPQCQVTHPVSNHSTHKMVNMKNITTGHTFNPLTTVYELYEDWQKHTNPY